MVGKEKIDLSEKKQAHSDQASTEKKNRPEHSYCQFYLDGFCTNRASLFYKEVRQLDDPFCSTFRKRDAQ